MPNMGYKGIYAAANSNIGGRILSNDLLPAIRGGFFPVLDFNYLLPSDPQFPYTTMLLKAVGSNTQQNYTFLDSSTNAFTITRNGDVTQGAFSPYGIDDGEWSAYFDGNGDYLSVPNNAGFDFGTGNFTVEAWIYPTTLVPGGGTNDVSNVINTFPASGTISGWGFSYNPTGYVLFSAWVGGTQQSITATSNPVAINTWNHIAVTNSGGTYKMFVNGVSVTFTGSISQAANSGGNALKIGGLVYAGYPDYCTGYISNVRVNKGNALYTAAFTPSTAGLTAVSGTSLLTCQSNRFVDNSTNNFAITRNGDCRVSALTPFNQNNAYVGSTYGGSAYFDGTGDSLAAASNAAFAYGTGDFTWECWIYPTTSNWTSGTGNFYILDHGSNGGTLNYYQNILRYYNPTTGGSSVLYTTGGGALPAYAWSHIAVCRVSGTTYLYVNGVLKSSAADSNNFGTQGATVGDYGSAGYGFVGYISNVRLIKGTAVYTTAFTPPSAPLTAITNTSYLLNGTNAGIIDASRKNNMYTISGAKVATNVFKYDKSIVLNGTSDYVSIPNDPMFNLPGDFTVETWFNFTSLGASPYTFVGNYNGSTAGWELQFRGDASNVFRWGFGDTAVLNSSTQSLSTGTWYHLAATRSGSTLRLFLNGTQIGSTTSSTSFTSAAALWIGGLTGIGQYFPGYLEDLRITNGYARYTANFTPPTTSLATR